MLLLVTMQPVGAVECFDYRTHFPLVGTAAVPGPAQGVALAGEHAYVAAGEGGLAIFLVSNLAFPVFLGSVDTPGIARRVAVAGDLAVLAEGETGIAICDVSDPQAPLLLGALDTAGHAWAVALSAAGDQAYVACDGAGLAVVDLSDPVSPILAGSLDTPGLALDVAVDGDYVFVADHWSGVQIVDVSDPLAPTIAAQIPTSSETVVGVAIRNDLVYVAEGEQPSGLAIYNISNPIAPSYLSYENTPGVSGVAVGQEFAHLQAGSLVYMIDVREPSQPSIAGGAPGPFASGSAARGDHLFVVGGASLRVFEARSPGSPLLHRRSYVYASVVSAATFGSLAFVSVVFSSAAYPVLDILDATSAAMVRLGSIDLQIPLFDIVALDNRVYGSTLRSFQIIDITNPAKPMILGDALLPGDGYGVAVSGSHAFAATDGAGLTALDISDPASPFVIASLPLPGAAYDVAVTGSLAVVACRTEGVFTVDVTDPSAMTILGHADTPGEARGVRAAGGHAYVADGDAGLVIIDITDPLAPLLLGQADTPNSALDLSLSGDFAYVADGASGFRVIDILNPSSPLDLGGDYPGFGQSINHNTYVPGGAGQVATTDQFVCVAAGMGGFRIYPHQCRRATPVAMTNLSATGGDSGITLRCRVHADLTRLSLWRAVGSALDAPFTPLADITDPPRGGEEWHYLDPDVRSGVTYAYELIAGLLDGQSERVGPVHATATPREAEASRLLLWPNPASDRVFMELVPAPAICSTVRVYDAAGRCVRRLELDPSDAPDGRWDGRDGYGRPIAGGIYYLRVEGGGRNETARLTWVR